MKEFIEMPFGAKDSELCGWEYTIPVGFVASIEKDKIIVKKEESEDEKIRGKLLQWLKLKLSNPKVGFVYEEMKQWIAWLEKQGEQKLYVNDNAKEMFIRALERVEEQNNKGYKLTDCDKNSWWEDFKAYTSCIIEQKPADNVEPKFKVGDWIVDKSGLAQQVLDFRGGIYTCTYNSFTTDCESNYHLWTIQDAKDGDVLFGSGRERNVILIFRGIGNAEWDDVIDYHCYYDYHRKEFIVQKDLEYWGNTENNQLKPATKEQCDLLFQKMKEAGYEWDAEKKKLKKEEEVDNLHNYLYGEQNPA